jgi:hypothetical protein
MMAAGGGGRHEWNNAQNNSLAERNRSMDAAMPARVPASAARRPWYAILYVQVLIAIVAGVALGYFYPDAAKAMKRSAMASSP